MNIKDIIWDKVVVKCEKHPELSTEYREALVSVRQFNTAGAKEQDQLLYIRASNGYNLGFYSALYSHASVKEVATNYMKISANWWGENKDGTLLDIPLEIACYL